MDQPAGLDLDPALFRMSSIEETADLRKGMDEQLYLAASSGKEKLLNQLLHRKPDVLYEITPSGNTALHVAAYFGHKEFVEILLGHSRQDAEAGKQFVRAKNMEGNTALHEAARGGHYKIVEVLLNLKDEDLVRATNVAGETALFKAADEGHINIATQLWVALKVAVSDNIETVTKTYETHRWEGIFEPLREVFNKLSESVLKKRHAEVVEILLREMRPAAEYNLTRSSDGQTPLHRAVLNGNKDVVEKLLKHRSELLQQGDHCNRTPLHIAALIPVANPSPLDFLEPKYVEDIRQIGKMLLEEDSSVCYRADRNGQSPLHIAVKEGNVSLMQEILKRRPDCLHMEDKDGKTALHLAVENAQQIFERVQVDLRIIIFFLISKEFNINRTDRKGRTPLDIAIESTNKDPQLFIGIQNCLCRYGARASKMVEVKTRRTSLTPVGGSKENKQIVSVNAVLIATVAFAVAFTLPGNHNSTSSGISSIFTVLVIFDALAFCYSIASAILLIYASSQVEDPIISDMCLAGLWIALLSIGMTFGAAIHLVVAPICLWLAIVVWVMVSYLPIWIWLMSCSGKLLLLGDPATYLRALIEPFIIIIKTLCSPIRTALSMSSKVLTIVVYVLIIVVEVLILVPIAVVMTVFLVAKEVFKRIWMLGKTMLGRIGCMESGSQTV